MAALSMLQLEARRKCAEGASVAGAKLIGEQRRVGLSELSSEKGNAEEKEVTSGLV